MLYWDTFHIVSICMGAVNFNTKAPIEIFELFQVATLVNITVLDVNDNPPVFTSSQVTAYTFEGGSPLEG